jgi:uncharacterized membrane protein YjgN (DUF898 family)
MSKFEYHSKGGKVFWGAVLVLAGFLILLHNLGYVNQDIIRFWPVLIILWGIKKIID